MAAIAQIRCLLQAGAAFQGASRWLRPVQVQADVMAGRWAVVERVCDVRYPEAIAMAGMWAVIAG